MIRWASQSKKEWKMVFRFLFLDGCSAFLCECVGYGKHKKGLEEQANERERFRNNSNVSLLERGLLLPMCGGSYKVWERGKVCGFPFVVYICLYLTKRCGEEGSVVSENCCTILGGKAERVEREGGEERERSGKRKKGERKRSLRAKQESERGRNEKRSNGDTKDQC